MRPGDWGQLEQPAPDELVAGGVTLRRGSRVVLHPRRGGDVFDLVLEGRGARVEEIVQITDGALALAVTVDDDPGRELGAQRLLGHRFFFTPEEVEPTADAMRILVAGIGNVFLGDDGFGVAVAQRLARTELPAGVIVEDYGIRGMDLAYALSGFDVALLIDATPRGRAPGTLYVIEPELDAEDVAPEAHAMDPVKVLALARALGGPLPRVLVIGCEPALIMTGEEEIVAALSEPVRAAIPEAAALVESLVAELLDRGDGRHPHQPQKEATR